MRAVPIRRRRLQDVEAHVEHPHTVPGASVGNGGFHLVEELRQALGIIGGEGSGLALIRKHGDVDQLRAIGLRTGFRAVQGAADRC